MMGDAITSHFGLQLLQWALSETDLWTLAYRCANFMNKIHEPLERSAAVLDQILTHEEDELQFSDFILADNNYNYIQLELDLNYPHQLEMHVVNGEC